MKKVSYLLKIQKIGNSLLIINTQLLGDPSRVALSQKTSTTWQWKTSGDKWGLDDCMSTYKPQNERCGFSCGRHHTKVPGKPVHITRATHIFVDCIFEITRLFS
jgi:hypothetical protein